MKDVSVMIGEAKFNYRVGLLIERNSEVLVETNPAIDFVVFPGGRVKTLEDSASALKREIKEEMGIDIDTNEIKLHSLFENFFEYEGIKVHELYILYKLEIKPDDKRFKDNMINMDSDASYYKWVNKDLKDVELLPKELKGVIDSKEFTRVVVK